MITNEKMQELVVQTSDIVNAAFGMGHVRFRPTEMLSSPIAAVVLQRLIDDYDFELTKPIPWDEAKRELGVK